MTMRSLLLRRLARCLDDRGKIERAVAGGGEGFVEVARLGADRRVGIDARRRLDREAQILEHQRGREAARIIVIRRAFGADAGDRAIARHRPRSEEHTSALQSLMRNPYAVFCLKNKKPYRDTSDN